MIYYLRKKRLSTFVNLLSIPRYFFFCLGYLYCEPCSLVCLQITTTVLEQYVLGIETDSPVQSIRVLRLLDPSGLGLQQRVRIPNWVASWMETQLQKEVTSLKEQAKEKSSAEKDGKYRSPGCSPAMLPRLCIANRLQGRRM